MQRSMLGIAVTGLLAAHAAPAYAQGRSPEAAATATLDEIVVTARKREEQLTDVPISIAVLDGSEIERSNLLDLRDYATRIPNLAFANSGSRTRSQLSIRGISDLNGSLFGSPNGVYVDEIPVGGTGSNVLDDMPFLDLERIEVLRGPQGTLYGRNTIGGAVNYVTRKPGNELRGAVNAGVERFGTYRMNGFASVPVVEDRLALHVSGTYRRSDGYIENPVLGRSFESDVAGGRLAVRFTPSEALTVDLSAQKTRLTMDGLEVVPYEDFLAQRYVLPAGYMAPNELNYEMYSARIEIDFGPASLISITSFNESNGVEAFDADFAPPDILGITSLYSGETIYQEVRLQSSGEGALTWTLGGAYSDSDASDDYFEIRLGDDFEFDFMRGSRITSGGVTTVKQKAVFGELEYAFTTRLRGTLGLRYTRDEVSTDQVSGGTGFFEGDAQFAFEDEFSEVTPKATVTYDLAPDWMAYATAAKGYKTGGLEVSVFDRTANTFGPETAWSYELGTKGAFFDRRLTLAAAVFQMDWKDLQVQSIELGGLISRVANAGEARIRGLELEANAQLADGWTLSAGVGLLDAEFTDYRNSPTGDLTGNEVPLAPDVTFNASAEYAFAVGARANAYVRAELSHVGEQEIDAVNDPFGRLDSYSLGHVRAGVRFDRLEFGAFVENVTDELYSTDNRPAGEPPFPVPSIVTVNQPRTWGVFVGYRFGE